ncbi:MAG: hypothetical protein J6Y78_06380 [Paludibacteraceae bacterium]|nr:hypothetical protein [Paludibacteraceae bacterium]
MANKKRSVDVLSVNFRYADGEARSVQFSDILRFMNNREYRLNEKIFNFTLLNCQIPDCMMAIIVTTQDSDIPPKRNKNTGTYSQVLINPEEEGFAYANILFYDVRRNILLYEVNKNGCFPNQFREFVYNHWNTEEDNVRFDISFPPVIRANEYQRMLQMDYYKKISIELYAPTELVNCFNENSDSIYNNFIKHQVNMGVQSNANTITIEQVALQKRVNPMGLSHSMVRGLVDAVKMNIADRGHRLNVQQLRIEGYTYDSEDPNKCKPIDILADSFNEYFKIPDIQVHSDVQQLDRVNGITGLYNKLLPEFRQLRGQ